MVWITKGGVIIKQEYLVYIENTEEKGWFIYDILDIIEYEADLELGFYNEEDGYDEYLDIVDVIEIIE